MISQNMNNSRISNHSVTITQVSGDDKFYKTIENNAYQINFRVKNIIEKYGKNYFKEAL